MNSPKIRATNNQVPAPAPTEDATNHHHQYLNPPQLPASGTHAQSEQPHPRVSRLQCMIEKRAIKTPEYDREQRDKFHSEPLVQLRGTPARGSAPGILHPGASDGSEAVRVAPAYQRQTHTLIHRPSRPSSSSGFPSACLHIARKTIAAVSARPPSLGRLFR